MPTTRSLTGQTRKLMTLSHGYVRLHAGNNRRVGVVESDRDVSTPRV